MIRFSKKQIARREHEQLDPGFYDFRWNSDYTECVAVPLAWHDDASYAEYQGDPLGGEPGDDASEPAAPAAQAGAVAFLTYADDALPF